MIKDISFEAGYIVVTTDSGPPRRYSAKRFLQAADIPDLTIDSLTLLTSLAQVVMVILRTLIKDGILTEETLVGFDFEELYGRLVDDLSADDLSDEEEGD